MRQERNKGSPSRGSRVLIGKVLAVCRASLAACSLAGCKANPTELRGKTAFGPEFRNRGNNTSEVRYTEQQGFEVKWDNGWTTGTQYRRRDVDDGSGDNENRVMFEVGYPIWKAPKKPDKTAERIESLEREIQEMRERAASLKTPSGAHGGSQAAR